jgi:hypothetical protein
MKRHAGPIGAIRADVCKCFALFLVPELDFGETGYVSFCLMLYG